jgi:hypothetical protein
VQTLRIPYKAANEIASVGLSQESTLWECKRPEAKRITTQIRSYDNGMLDVDYDMMGWC